MTPLETDRTRRYKLIVLAFTLIILYQSERSEKENLNCGIVIAHGRLLNDLSTCCRRAIANDSERYKKEDVGVHVPNDLTNEFLRLIDIRIENFATHPHLYKHPLSRSVKALKRKMER